MHIFFFHGRIEYLQNVRENSDIAVSLQFIKKLNVLISKLYTKGVPTSRAKTAFGVVETSSYAILILDNIVRRPNFSTISGDGK